MADIDLSRKFPDMQPITAAPSLQMINGIGTTVYGSRDHDAETGTYVTTQCFTVLFIPVLALRAFRVAKAQGGGWYFLGREPLSLLARVWNLLIVGGGTSVVAAILLMTYFNTPEYKAGRQLAKARDAAVAKKPAEAAQLYREVIRSGTKHAAEANQGFQELWRSTADQGTAAQVNDVLAIAVSLQQSHQGGLTAQQIVDDAVRAAGRLDAEDPTAVLALVNKAAEVAPEPENLDALRQKLLEKVVRQRPDDVDVASQLAVIYEAQKKPELCRKLLEPLAGKLGKTEGARVLGQIYAEGREPEKSLELLTPYATENLQKLHDAEKHLEATAKSRTEQTIREMETGKAPGFSMARYKSLGKDAQQAMVDDYLASRLKDDPDLKKARDAIVANGKVVPVALDLGVLLLHRGQKQTDATARQRDLQKAEEMFLAVRGQVGGDDMFRLYLGQVYYWLGKHAEGRKLFDELLAAHRRKGDVALKVASILREVGASSEARTLAEEVYVKETDKEKKYQAASMMALTAVELDERIKWLRLCDPKDKDSQATLEWLLGIKDVQDGQDESALAHLRSATQIYSTMTESAAVLNNSALVWLSLADITGDPEDFKQAAVRLEKASALDRADSILLGNTASALTTAAVGEVVGDQIDLRLLKTTASFDLLSYLYNNAAERKQVVGRLKSRPDMKRAMDYYDRVMLLAPRSPLGYAMTFRYYNIARDTPALKALSTRLAPVKLDMDDLEAQSRKHYRGERDAESLKTYQKSIDRSRATLAAAREKGGPTLAVAAGRLAGSLEGAAEFGLAVKEDEVVSLAEESHRAAPSAGTASVLRSALLFRAARQLAATDATLAAMLKRSRRSLGADDVLAAALEQPGLLRDKISGHADVKRAQELIVQTRKDLPDAPTSWQWAMLHVSHPEEARKIADLLRTDETYVIEDELTARFSALNAPAAMHAHWRALALGDPAAAEAALAACKKEGVPLPWEATGTGAGR